MTPSPTHVAGRPWRRARYRIGQFWRGVSARVTPEERERVAQILPPDALALFERMPVDAQRHSLNVLHAVHAAGLRDADLDAAALLHDVGKLAADESGVRLGLWLRRPLVLLEAVSPRTLARLANGGPGVRPALRSLRTPGAPAHRRGVGGRSGLQRAHLLADPPSPR